MTVSRYSLSDAGRRCVLAAHMLLHMRLQGNPISACGLPGVHASPQIPEQVAHCLQPSSAGINPCQSCRMAWKALQPACSCGCPCCEA